MLLELVEGFLAQYMLDAARILSGGLSVHAESGEERGEHGVALVNAGGDLACRIRSVPADRSGRWET